MSIPNMDSNDPNPDPDPDPTTGYSSSPSYALSGKIMLSAIVILFFVVVLMVCLHLYARWYLLRARRRYLRRRNRNRNRRPTLVFYVDPSAGASGVASRGLSASVIKSLPVFIFSAATHPDPIECAVCLSEFEENESGRVLPNCKHSFHVDCIDMWFHSHSTCPLCRSPVESSAEREKSADVVISIPDPVRGNDPGSSSSGSCDKCQNESGEAGTSATSSEERRRKPAAIEVPSRNAVGFEDDSTRSNSPVSRSFRSPMSRMLSFKRILSRDRRTAPSPSAGTAAASPSACTASVTESDIERGREETQ